MKKYLFYIFLLFPITIYSQYNCKSFLIFNGKDYYDNIILYLKDNNYVQFAKMEDMFWTSYLFDGTYSIYNDSILVMNLKEYYSQSDYKRYYFKIIEDGIFESLSDLSNICKKGDIFYCRQYDYGNYHLFGSKWENGKKNGLWFYVDSLSKVYQVIYKDNLIIEKKLAPVSNKLH